MWNNQRPTIPFVNHYEWRLYSEEEEWELNKQRLLCMCVRFEQDLILVRNAVNQSAPIGIGKIPSKSWLLRSVDEEETVHLLLWRGQEMEHTHSPGHNVVTEWKNWVRLIIVPRMAWGIDFWKTFIAHYQQNEHTTKRCSSSYHIGAIITTYLSGRVHPSP